MLQAPGLGEGERQEPATPRVYVEACSIVRSLLGVAARSRVIPSGDAEVGGLLFTNLHPTPSLDAVIMGLRAPPSYLAHPTRASWGGD